MKRKEGKLFSVAIFFFFFLLKKDQPDSVLRHAQYELAMTFGAEDDSLLFCSNQMEKNTYRRQILVFVIHKVKYKLILIDNELLWITTLWQLWRCTNTSCSSHTPLPAVYQHPHVYFQEVSVSTFRIPSGLKKSHFGYFHTFILSFVVQ